MGDLLVTKLAGPDFDPLRPRFDDATGPEHGNDERTPNLQRQNQTIKAHYDLWTDDAEADLRGIIRYTRQEWSAKQVRAYVAKLKAGIARVASGQGVFKELVDLYPALRMTRCEHHLPRENAPTLIVAIFHECMDLMARLADRLND